MPYVRRTLESPPKVTSAVYVAIGMGKPAALTFLLDVVDNTGGAVQLSRKEVMSLLFLTGGGGSSAKRIFKVLESRGVNFKVMVELDEHSRIAVADLLLAFAWKSGDASLVRYLVKDLGVVATTGQLEFIIDCTDFFKELRPCRDDFKKYECVACDAVGITQLCTGCKVVRYCSTACQRHWKAGGHIEECRRIQRHEKMVTEEDISRASGHIEECRRITRREKKVTEEDISGSS